MMIEFFQKLFGRQPSGETAKERLRLVLMSDHLSLAPDMIDRMKADLVDVISRYVEVDRDKIDVHFEHQEKALAMLANIPILGVNRDGGKREEPSAAQPALALNQTGSAAPRPKRRRRKKAVPSDAGPPAGSPAPAAG